LDKAKKSRAVDIVSESEGETRILLSGHVSLENLHGIMVEIKSFFRQARQERLVVDLAAVDYIDSAGALFLLQMEQEAHERSTLFSFANMSSKVEGVIRILDRRTLTSPPLAEKVDSAFFQEIGEASVGFLGNITQSITFLGTLISEIVVSILHPFSVRWKDVLVYMKKVGVDGLPILALISFLLGLIMAFMSSLQLKQFGANSYVASLVALAMVRELGPIMTAILVAGRSGSAFAAEIGTMKVNEEVDALVTMGFNPIRFLAIPKVFASMLVVPILTMFSDLFAIAGGMLVGVMGLGLTLYTYMDYTVWALQAFDITTGFVKSVVFAFLIAGIGCQRGFQVRGGAEEVGNATTSAVVSGLFLIIVTDSTFAVVLNYIRW
jgi:phospholipid/cholesterol/gamma-HCH transport system permease protein